MCGKWLLIYSYASRANDYFAHLPASPNTKALEDEVAAFSRAVGHFFIVAGVLFGRVDHTRLKLAAHNLLLAAFSRHCHGWVTESLNHPQLNFVFVVNVEAVN